MPGVATELLGLVRERSETMLDVRLAEIEPTCDAGRELRDSLRVLARVRVAAVDGSREARRCSVARGPVSAAILRLSSGRSSD